MWEVHSCTASAEMRKEDMQQAATAWFWRCHVHSHVDIYFGPGDAGAPGWGTKHLRTHCQGAIYVSSRRNLWSTYVSTRRSMMPARFAAHSQFDRTLGSLQGSAGRAVSKPWGPVHGQDFVDLVAFPRFANITWQHGEIEAGDILFIPHTYWHQASQQSSAIHTGFYMWLNNIELVLYIKLVCKNSKNVDGWTMITMMIRYDKIVKVSHSLHHVESHRCDRLQSQLSQLFRWTPRAEILQWISGTSIAF